jgi:predicted permease
MWSLLSDLRLAFRSAIRRPGATALVLVSLAATIGVAAAAFSILDAIVWRSLPVREPGELVAVWARDREQRPDQLTWREYRSIAARVPGLSGILAQSRHSARVRLADRMEIALIAAVSDNYFDMLGVGASPGAVFHAGAGGDAEIVISHRYWLRALSGDPEVLSHPLRVNDVDLRVVAVLPPGFSGANRGLAVDLFVPIQTAFGVLRYGSLDNPRNTDFELIARLKPAATLDGVQREVEATFRLLDQNRESPEPGRTALIRRLDGSDDRETRAISTVFASIVLLVLLVAAANIANMRLALGEERRGDTAIRVALGASRGALWRQQLSEMLLLGATGTALAALVASWLIGMAPALLFAGERYAEFYIRFDARTFLFSLGAMLLVALVGTVLPLRAASSVALSMTGVSRGLTRRSPWVPALVVVQVAFVTGIVSVAGLLGQSLENVSAIRPAMDPDRPLVLTDGYWLAPGDPAARAESLAASFSVLPGVKRVAFARRAPLSGSGGGATVPVELQGQPAFAFRFNQVSPSYFETTGGRVVGGRAFTSADSAGSTKVIMVSEALARRFFARSRDAIGAWVRVAGGDRQIVGIVEDGPTIHLRESAEPYLYFPFAQRPSGEVTFFVEAPGNPADLVGAVRKQLAADSTFVPYGVRTMAEHMNAARSEERLTVSIAGALGLLGLVLAAAGLYGVMQFAVSRRTREFGVRMALGATGRTLGFQIVRESSALVAAGMSVGVGLAYAGYRLLRYQLYGISSWDPTSLLGAAIVVVAVALVATLQPALRAARVDPVIALRQP